MRKFIKKFEKFSADLNDKAQKTEHGTSQSIEKEAKDMTIDEFRKCHNYILSGEWDSREDESDFDSKQNDLIKYKNLSPDEKSEYLKKLDVSIDTSI